MGSGISAGRRDEVRRVNLKAARSVLSRRPAVVDFLLVLLIGLGIWEWLSRAGTLSDIILPSPSSIISSLEVVLTGPGFWNHLLVTLVEVLISFGISAVAGCTLGAVFGFFPAVRRLFYPYIVMGYSIPKITLAPIFITWLGFGIESKIALAVSIAFFPLFINTMAGLMATPPDALELMKSLRASRWQVFWKVAAPSALPTIFAGAKMGMTFALLGVMVGEFQGAREGLGYLVLSYTSTLRMDRVFAVILVVSLLSVMLFYAIDVIERRVAFWSESRSSLATM
jgi:NitT/TauT family transport system permease protein